MPDAPKWIRTPAGYLMVLTQGDDLFAELSRLMLEADIPSANPRSTRTASAGACTTRPSAAICWP